MGKGKYGSQAYTRNLSETLTYVIVVFDILLKRKDGSEAYTPNLTKYQKKTCIVSTYTY